MRCKISAYAKWSWPRLITFKDTFCLCMIMRPEQRLTRATRALGRLNQSALDESDPSQTWHPYDEPPLNLRSAGSLALLLKTNSCTAHCHNLYCCSSSTNHTDPYITHHSCLPFKKNSPFSSLPAFHFSLSLSTLQGFGCAKAHRIAAHTK